MDFFAANFKHALRNAKEMHYGHQIIIKQVKFLNRVYGNSSLLGAGGQCDVARPFPTGSDAINRVTAKLTSNDYCVTPRGIIWPGEGLLPERWVRDRTGTPQRNLVQRGV